MFWQTHPGYVHIHLLYIQMYFLYKNTYSTIINEQLIAVD